MKKFFTINDPVLPMHHPRVLIETAVECGADRETLLRSANISEEAFLQPEARISYAQLNALERSAVHLTKDPGLGLKFGASIQFSHLGVLGLGVMSSINVEAAFRLFLQYYREVAPGWELDIRVEGERGLLTARETISRGEMLPFATEAVLGGIRAIATQALGGQFPVIEVRFAYPRPDYHERYRDYYDFPMRFDCERTEAEFDAALLSVRISSADPATAVIAEQYFANKESRVAHLDGLTAQVRKVLVSRSTGRANLEEVARALQTSTRSLRRGLQQMGTSYQTLVDEVLRERAEEKIRSSSAKLEQIAQELGFSDVRSFRRAFKRWTGQSPADFRSGA